jgi:hypothetical protein
LLTPNSLASKWVQREVQGAVALEVDGHLRVVCVLRGIEAKSLPPLLRPSSVINWIERASAERQLIEVCAGRQQETSWTSERAARTAGDVGLSLGASNLAKALCAGSRRGLKFDPMANSIELAETMAVSTDEVEEWADELKTRGLVATNFESRGGIRISALPDLFWLCDPLVKGWSVDADARAIANHLLAVPDEYVSPREFIELFGWAPRRLNPALAYMQARDFAVVEEGLGLEDFIAVGIRATARTRRLAKGLVE